MTNFEIIENLVKLEQQRVNEMPESFDKFIWSKTLESIRYHQDYVAASYKRINSLITFLEKAAASGATLAEYPYLPDDDELREPFFRELELTEEFSHLDPNEDNRQYLLDQKLDFQTWISILLEVAYDLGEYTSLYAEINIIGKETCYLMDIDSVRFDTERMLAYEPSSDIDSIVYLPFSDTLRNALEDAITELCL